MAKKRLLDPNLMGPAQAMQYVSPDDVVPPDQIPVQRARTVSAQPGSMPALPGDVATAMGPQPVQPAPAAPQPAADAVQPVGGVMGAMRQPTPSTAPESFFSKLGFGGGDGDNFRDKLGKLGAIMMMLDPMSAHAGAAMLQLQQAGHQERKETKRQNDTAQWLQGQGVKPAEAAFMAANPTALNAWNTKRLAGENPKWEFKDIPTADGMGTQTFMVNMNKPSEMQPVGGVKPTADGKPMTLAAGSSVWDPRTGKVLFTAPEDPNKAAPTRKIQKNGMEQQQELVNGEWRDLGEPKPPTGFTVEQTPGGFKMTQGPLTGGKGPTEAEQKTIGYRERMMQAEPDIQKFTPDLVTPTAAVANIGNKLLSGTSLEDVPYAIQDKNITAGTNSGQSWLTGVLRGDSGGAIGHDEWRDYKRIYIPMPGDDEAEIARKAARRKAVMDGIEKALGPNAGAKENDEKRKAILDQYATAQVDVAPAPAQQTTTPPANKGGWTITPVT